MDEKELIILLKAPKTRNDGFKVLLQLYQEKLYWVVRKLVIDHDDANDLIQDIFIKIYSNIEKFKGDAQLYTWIYRIAVNESLSFLKKKKKFQQEESDEYLANTLTASTYLDGNEVALKLQRAILTLPEKQRVVFNLKYFDELKYDEIAEITETTVGALKASYHHAVKKIEEYVSQH